MHDTLDAHSAVERRSRRLACSLLAALTLDAFLIVGALWLGSLPRHGADGAQPMRSDAAHLVWLEVAGPGGGGGGGGNERPDPPRRAERPGHDAVTVAARQPAIADITNEPAAPDPVPALAIPVQTLAAALQDLPGTIAEPGAMPLSQGSGTGGGAGSGAGPGDGPGGGSGLCAGRDRGVGGDVYQVGADVTSPVDTYAPKPSYTADAMRAKIQGRVLVECVVQPSGVCTDVQVLKGLDSRYGLDLEAIRSVKLWRFRPGTRRGRAVPVKVTIAVDFSLR